MDELDTIFWKMGSKRKPHNSELTNAQRKMICLRKDAASITNKELSLWATENFSFPVSEMTISRTLKGRDKWLSNTAMPDGKRDRKLLCPEVEDATYSWFLATQDKGGTLSDALICEAARRFYAGLDHVSTAKPLVFSHGWLGRFKKRHGIKGHLTNGERQLVHTSEEVQHQIDTVKSIIANYEPGDVFYMEGTGLLFALQPFKTFTKRTSSTKMRHERFTVGFTANLDGSIKIPPLVINMYARPQAFISRHIRNPLNLGILWHTNHLTRMTAEIFEKYVLDFEKRMLVAGKSKVLLLIYSEYGKLLANVEKYLKITVIKFLPNSSGLYRYEDAGIISFVKACYRKHLLKHQIDCILAGKDSNVDVYNAVVCLEKAWRVDVTPTVIVNGFRNMYLYKEKWQLFDNLTSFPEARGSLSRRSFELNEQLTKISQLLEQLGSTNREALPDMSADEYVHFEERNGLVTSHEVREDEIWGASHTAEHEKENADAVVPVGVGPRVTFSTVQASLQEIETYLLQQQEDAMEMLQSLRALGENLANHHAKIGRQRDIARLFVCDELVT